MKKTRIAPALGASALLLTALAASGCTPAGVVVGAGATVGLAAAQERSVGSALDDATIQVNINHLLLQKSQRLFADVDLAVHEGRVMMTGKVPTAEDRVEAARLAWQVSGVREVLNELQVTDQAGLGHYARDSWIVTQLRTKLITDGQIIDINYTLDSVNGTVYLLGIAQDQGELERVTRHARTIGGVRQVISHVQLKDDPRRRS